MRSVRSSLSRPGRLDHRAQRVPDPLGRVEPAGRQPRVALDDVRGDQRVLEVEGDDLTPGVEHLLAHPGHAIGADRRSRRGLHPGVLDDRRQVDLGDVGRPVDAARVDVEVGPVGGVEAVPDLHQVVDLVDRLALGVEPVELDVGRAPARPRGASSRSARPTRPAVHAAAGGAGPSRRGRASSWRD